MTTTRPLQQNGNKMATARLVLLRPCIILFPNYFAFVFQFVWLKLQSAGGVLRTLAINFLETAPKRRVRTPSRAAPPYSATLPSQPPTVAPPGVSALDISSSIAASITAAMQPVLDRLGRLEASPAISSTDDAAVSVPVQGPAHGKSSIFWSSISRTTVDKVVAGQCVEMASLPEA